jgi:two-component system cell cycle sensor histidine kinase/response regulator CckA
MADPARTVLVVEDAPQVRGFIARALRLHGYDILEADGAEEALSLCRRHAGSIALFLCNGHLPVITAEQLLPQLLALHPEAKVLAMSGWPKSMAVGNLVAAGTPFIAKPFTIIELVNKVREVIGAEAGS